MTRSKDRLGRGLRLALIGTAAVLVAMSACSGDDGSAPVQSGGKAGRGGTGGDDASAGTTGTIGAAGSAGSVGAAGESGFGGSAGMLGTGGLAGAGGLGATGGFAGTGGTGGTPSSDACPGPSAIPPDSFPLCPDNVRCVQASTGQICVSARCVPSSLVPNPEQLALLPDCPEPNSKCVPDNFVATAGQFLLKECRSLVDAEGRCVPVSLPAVRTQVDRLPQGVCEGTERCAPCFDPLSGASTSACSAGCGPGPHEPAKTFPACCNGLGACIPPALAGADAARLGKDTCATAAVCAPKTFSDASFVPSSCRSVGEAEGRCLPDCLPEIAAQAALLPRSSCAEHHLCAPCYDPVKSTPSAPVNTGACNHGSDTPKEPPKIFARCCTGNSGVCVPQSLIPDAQESLLGKDSCTAANTLCVPTELSDSSFVPPACNSLNGAEGRCLAPCLPGVASQASRLPRSTCPENRLCAPCYDPTNGTDTGACRIGSDSPKKPPYTFPKCCPYQGNNRGTCVPGSIVPPQGANLGPDNCPANGSDPFKCVPNIKVADINAKFPACQAQIVPLLPVDGGCVPDCMITDPLQRATLTMQTCAAGELCAPCTNPLDGTRTGACD